MFDPYKVLSVSRKASQREIKSAYRKLARSHHPDVNGCPEANAQFARITEAYKILSDPKTRALYDRGQYLRSEAAVDRARAIAFQARVNRIVDELIEKDRQEARARQQAVSVTTSFFLSTFAAALTQPPVFSLGILGSIVLLMLFAYGLWYLIKSLKLCFERYTYSPHFPSVIRLVELPSQPFTRKAALTFLACGYLFALAAGSAIGKWADGTVWLVFERGSILSVFILPPIAVMLVDGMRKLSNKLEQW